MIYGNGQQIVQGPGFVTILQEMVHEARVIPLDGRPHAGPNIRSYMGDPRGHWEGNKLVVEPAIPGYGNFLSRLSSVVLFPFSKNSRILCDSSSSEYPSIRVVTFVRVPIRSK